MRYSLALLSCVLAFALPARAEFTLTFDRSNYDVAAGGTVNVDVRLAETGTSLLADNGLIGAGLLVHFNLPASAGNPAQVVAIAPNSVVNPGSPDFDFLSTNVVPAGAGAPGAAELDWALTSNTLFPPNGESSVLIGRFTFVAGSVVGDVTNLATDLSGLKFVSGDGTDIDDAFGIKSTTATITVATVATPEPSSLALALAALLAFGACRNWLPRRRRVEQMPVGPA